MGDTGHFVYQYRCLDDPEKCSLCGRIPINRYKLE